MTGTRKNPKWADLSVQEQANLLSGPHHSAFQVASYEALEDVIKKIKDNKIEQE